MSHRYESVLFHCVFSTKERKPLIPESMKRDLWAYMGGIARTNKFKALGVGGMSDHVHVLLSLPATLLVTKAVQLIKGGSSKWLNDHLPRRSFAWQDAYGVFTIGISQSRTRFVTSTSKKNTTPRSALPRNGAEFWIVTASRNSVLKRFSAVSCGDSATLLLAFPPLKRRAIFMRPGKPGLG